MTVSPSIEDICKQVAKTSALNACNFFVQSVAAKLWGETAPGFVNGTANEIVPRFSDGTVFVSLGSDDDLATKYADDGFFVVGGLAKKVGSGHVFVVVPGGPSPKGVPTPWMDKDGKPYKSRGGYPYAYNGSSAAALRIPSRISVDLMFSNADMASVTYGAIADPRLKPANTRPAGAASSVTKRMSCDFRIA